MNISQLKDKIIELQQDNYRLEASNEKLREYIREAYEIYAGSEGCVPETATEVYMNGIVSDIVKVLSKALKD